MLIVTGREVRALLDGAEGRIIDAVRRAYITHARHDSALPHSTFLTFPNNPHDRIIALPAYLGGGCNTAGVKWVASFPGNVARGVERASAVVVLNSMETGRPRVVLEGSLINAKRTAASAALAALTLHEPFVERVAVIGCGVINFEVVRFLLASFPALACVVAYDLDPRRSKRFAEQCRQLPNPPDVRTAEDVDAALGAAPLISLATTATVPHIADLSACEPGATILHVSLRDLSPEAILSATNVVDDVDHVLRAATSVHLAEQRTGHRDFIAGTLGDLLLGTLRLDDRESPAVFSPFGLGVLDVAVGSLVHDLARERGLGTVIGDFLPEPWDERVESPIAGHRTVHAGLNLQP
ncbi:MAG: 2,3-diaminopropionate biosynthesis protein SbnB [Gammaproteobacteria bacterium]|nr:2,3-diaminopropionate biosynthesis protein SbnB [Gammaproteobacteria bacterium]